MFLAHGIGRRQIFREELLELKLGLGDALARAVVDEEIDRRVRPAQLVFHLRQCRFRLAQRRAQRVQFRLQGFCPPGRARPLARVVADAVTSVERGDGRLVLGQLVFGRLAAQRQSLHLVADKQVFARLGVGVDIGVEPCHGDFRIGVLERDVDDRALGLRCRPESLFERAEDVGVGRRTLPHLYALAQPRLDAGQAVARRQILQHSRHDTRARHDGHFVQHNVFRRQQKARIALSRHGIVDIFGADLREHASLSRPAPLDVLGHVVGTRHPDQEQWHGPAQVTFELVGEGPDADLPHTARQLTEGALVVHGGDGRHPAIPTVFRFPRSQAHLALQPSLFAFGMAEVT